MAKAQTNAYAYELVVGPDGSIPASELARIGLHPGAHLRVVPEPPTRMSIEGRLPNTPTVTWDDFERASELAESELGHV